MISSDDTDVKDDEENQEKASSNKLEQVKEVSEEFISGITATHESTLGASTTTQTGLVSQRSTMQEAGSSETGFGSGISTVTQLFSIEHPETAIKGVDLGVSFKDEQLKEVSGELKSGTSTTAQESASGASITTETGLDSDRSTMVQAGGSLDSRFGLGISSATQMFSLGEESEQSAETAIKGVDLGVSFKDEQLKEVSGELKSGTSTTAQESASGASITTETGLDSERSTMVQAVGFLDSRFCSGISTATQMFSPGEESEHSAETAIKGVDVGVSLRVHGDWASKCVAASW